MKTSIVLSILLLILAAQVTFAAGLPEPGLGMYGAVRNAAAGKGKSRSPWNRAKTPGSA